MVTQHLRRSSIIGVIAAWALVIGISPGRAFALPTSSVASVQTASVRDVQIEAIVSALSTTPRARMHLRMVGISPAQLREKLARLDDVRLAQVAQKADAVKAGGELGLIIGLLVLTILIIVVVMLLDKKIEIKDED